LFLLTIDDVSGQSTDVVLGATGRTVKVVTNDKSIVQFFLVTLVDAEIVVVDNIQRRVIWLNRQGQPTGFSLLADSAKFAMGSPTAVFVHGQSSIGLIDAQNSSISWFQKSRLGVSLLESRPLQLSGVSGACSAGKELFVMGSSSPNLSAGVLQRFEDKGLAPTTLGTPFGAFRRAERLTYGTGVLMCPRSIGGVIMASALMGELRSYSSSGVLRWTTALPEFQRVRIAALPNGHVRYRYAPDGAFDRVRSIVELSEDLMAVQVERTLGATGETISISTYLVSVRKGALLKLRTDLLEILAADERTLFMVDPSDRRSLFVRPYTLARTRQK
jgi:hypothetical protein